MDSAHLHKYTRSQHVVEMAKNKTFQNDVSKCSARLLTTTRDSSHTQLTSVLNMTREQETGISLSMSL